MYLFCFCCVCVCVFMCVVLCVCMYVFFVCVLCCVCVLRCVCVVVFGVVCVYEFMKQVQAAKKKAEGEEAKGDKALTSPVKRKGKQTKFRANKEQDLVAKSLHTGPKGMPKRMGPKIRHRNRGKGDTQVQAGKAKKGKKLSLIHI